MTYPAAQLPKTRRFRTLRSISALILREMATTYGRSPGGYLWAILEPVAAIALMSIIFSLLFRSPALGTNFPYFYAGGFLPFMMYATISSQIAASIRYSKALLAYPAVTFMDAIIARLLLNFMTHILVTFIVITGVIVIYDLKPILHWPSLFLAMSMAISMAIAVGTMNCLLISSYPLWERVWAIANRPMFIISGLLFIPEALPAKMREYMMYNPLAHVTSEMRKGMFASYDAVYVNATYVFTIAIVMTAISLLLLLRYHKDIVLK